MPMLSRPALPAISMSLLMTLAVIAGPAPARDAALDLGSVKVRMADGEASLASIVPAAPTIVHFWASWCVPCRDELPRIDVFAETLSQMGLSDRLVAVSVDRSDYAEVAAFLREDLKVGLPAVQDSSGRVGVIFALFGYPSTVLLDADHALIARYPGPISWAAPDMQAKLLAHLQGK